MIYLRMIFLIVMLTSNAYSFSSSMEEGGSSALAEQCRKLSLQLYELSSHQSRPICEFNLDGLNVYFASNYILLDRVQKAKEVITSAIIQVKFALDIGCDGSANISSVITGLQSVNNKLKVKTD